ncbi:hypothetical protein [Thermomonospora umbrina]|uniref:Uncharacterized protein n=1 Tax=Thermomonospora umbrina TaxID=111806 RepID=A0A3D9SXH0_9ACTN|nr:hypothetical protein [Thermomonospora umbrina]REF00653.1 hypothetical protein DFJ69_6209 [Thermomonospora umbrina]
MSVTPSDEVNGIAPVPHEAASIAENSNVDSSDTDPVIVLLGSAYTTEIEAEEALRRILRASWQMAERGWLDHVVQRQSIEFRLNGDALSLAFHLAHGELLATVQSATVALFIIDQDDLDHPNPVHILAKLTEAHAFPPIAQPPRQHPDPRSRNGVSDPMTPSNDTAAAFEEPIGPRTDNRAGGQTVNAVSQVPRQPSGQWNGNDDAAPASHPRPRHATAPASPTTAVTSSPNAHSATRSGTPRDAIEASYALFNRTYRNALDGRPPPRGEIPMRSIPASDMPRDLLPLWEPLAQAARIIGEDRGSPEWQGIKAIWRATVAVGGVMRGAARRYGAELSAEIRETGRWRTIKARASHGIRALTHRLLRKNAGTNRRPPPWRRTLRRLYRFTGDYAERMLGTLPSHITLNNPDDIRNATAQTRMRLLETPPGSQRNPPVPDLTGIDGPSPDVRFPAIPDLSTKVTTGVARLQRALGLVSRQGAHPLVDTGRRIILERVGEMASLTTDAANLSALIDEAGKGPRRHVGRLAVEAAQVVQRRAEDLIEEIWEELEAMCAEQTRAAEVTHGRDSEVWHALRLVHHCVAETLDDLRGWLPTGTAPMPLGRYDGITTVTPLRDFTPDRLGPPPSDPGPQPGPRPAQGPPTPVPSPSPPGAAPGTSSSPNEPPARPREDVLVAGRGRPPGATTAADLANLDAPVSSPGPRTAPQPEPPRSLPRFPFRKQATAARPTPPRSQPLSSQGAHPTGNRPPR